MKRLVVIKIDRAKYHKEISKVNHVAELNYTIVSYEQCEKSLPIEIAENTEKTASDGPVRSQIKLLNSVAGKELAVLGGRGSCQAAQLMRVTGLRLGRRLALPTFAAGCYYQRCVWQLSSLASGWQPRNRTLTTATRRVFNGEFGSILNGYPST